MEEQLTKLQGECDALVAEGNTLLTDAYGIIDREMAAFMESYLASLELDFADATKAKRCERVVQLQLIVGEMGDLVGEIQRRIAQGGAGTAPLHA